MKEQPIVIYDLSAGHYFRQLVEFLDAREIEKRLKQIEIMIYSEKGAYLNYWVLPNAIWWLGLKEAITISKKGSSFRGNVSRIMLHPLDTAVKLSNIYQTLPKFKREEYRSRILTDDILEPTLFEIECAFHLFKLGYEIEWVESKSDKQEKTPEFIAKRDGREIEVECKAKKADAGRRIERKLFYRVVDNFLPLIQENGLIGFLSMKTPSKIPKGLSWYKKSKEILKENITIGHNSIIFPEDIILELDLKNADGSKVPICDLEKMHTDEAHPYAHFAILGEKVKDSIINPIRFKLISKQTDKFLDDVLDSLKKAKKQFSGKRAGIICCMIPEIETFEGLQNKSALKNMTIDYFDNSAPDYINAVGFVSNLLRENNGEIIDFHRPSINFFNPKYNHEFGPNISVLE